MTCPNCGYQHEQEIAGRIKPDTITTMVCEHYKITDQQLKSKSRQRDYVLARQMCMVLIIETKALSYLREVGKLFNRDYTNVIHAKYTIADLCATDPLIKRDYIMFKEALREK